MDKLTIFWNDKTSDKFHWYLNHQMSSQASAGDQALRANQSLISTTNHLAKDLPDNYELLKTDIASLTQAAQGKRVELIISSQDVYSSQIQLPNKAKRHLSKAVPYLIEEALAEPLDDVFIAVGERIKEDTPVRAINLNYLEQLLDKFKSADIKLDAVYIDLDYLPIPESGYQLILSDDKVLVSQENASPWTCEISDFSWLVQKQLAEQDEELPVDIPLKIIANNDYKNETALFEKQLPMGRFSSEIDYVESVDLWLIENGQNNLNLLQGDFAVKKDSSPIKQIALRAASIIGIILFTHLLYQGSLWFTLNSENEALGEQKIALWKKAFPNKKYNKNRADKELRGYMTQVGGNNQSIFLPLLDSVSQKIPSLEKIYPTNLSYDSARNELRVDVIAQDLSILNQYRDDLKTLGLKVETNSATQRGDGYSSRLIIRK